VDEQTVRAVYLAVVGLADYAGVECLATDDAIAEAAGRSAVEVRDALHDLADRGEIRALGPDSNLTERTLVVLDHPDADRAIKRVLYGDRGPTDPLRWVRPAVRGWLGDGLTRAEVIRQVEDRLRRDGASNRRWDRAMVLANETIAATAAGRRS